MTDMLKKQLEKATSKSLICPYCKDSIDEEMTASCSSCKTPQHLECFREHGSCAVHACSGFEIDVAGERLPVETVQHMEVTLEEELEAKRLDEEWEQKMATRVRGSELIKAFLVRGAMASLAMAFGFGLASITFLDGFPFLESLVVLFFVLSMGLAAAAALLGTRRASKSIDLWHDVMGQSGFDPITGTSPRPRLPFEQGRVQDQHEG
jgi:hypothetical protein